MQTFTYTHTHTQIQTYITSVIIWRATTNPTILGYIACKYSYVLAYIHIYMCVYVMAKCVAKSEQ